jgi:hypothetical protein
MDGEVAGRVVEAERGGCLKVAGRGRDVEGIGEGLGEGGVVGVKREGVAVKLGGAGVDEIERVAGIVGELFENPGGDLSAAVGEGDAIEFIVDDGGGLSGCSDGGDRGPATCGMQVRWRARRRRGRAPRALWVS